MNEFRAAALTDEADEYFKLGDLKQAEQVCNIIINEDPDNVEALFLLGNIAHKKENPEDAAEYFKRAVKASPRVPVLHLNLAISLKESRKFDEAATALNEAIRLMPDYAKAWFNLGLVHEESGNLDKALDAYGKTLDLEPSHIDAILRTGDLYQRRNQLIDALECYKEAHRLNPGNFITCNNTGNVLKYMGRIDDALAWYRKAEELEPRERICASNYLMTMLLSQDCMPDEIFREHMRWSDIYERPLLETQEPHSACDDPERPLKIGYLSNDFKCHPVAFFIEPVLNSHDRGKYRIYCYSNCGSPDMITAQIERLADCWRPVAKLSDEELARLVREDNIDILVDLGGHTAHNRITVFARKPAPVQVAWLGYPATTGLKSIDYRITDPAADPPGLTDSYHSETLYRVSAPFICYRPPVNSPPVAPLPCLKNGFVTFGVFNHSSKITPHAVDLWCRILFGLPESKLLVKAMGLEHEQMRTLVEEMFIARGIFPERLTLKGKTPGIYGHLEMLGHADICLDTFPYNGTTTTCESLWMGVPVVGREGNSHVSRVCVSILDSVGLSALVAHSDEEYVELAIFLARDEGNLEILRNGLRERMRSSALLDTVGFTRKLENSFREMWRRWCKR